MSTYSRRTPTLDPDAPGLDEDTRRRRRVLAEMEQMSADELVELAKDAGILTADGQLAPQYRDDAEPSACRPTD
jgi:hypothetical protein